MKKLFFPLLILAAAVFGIWLYLRIQVWSNPEFFPAEATLIYLRDSSMFLGMLRAVSLLFWGFGAWQLWSSGRAGYIWAAAVLYAGFLLLDGYLLVSQYYAYKLTHEIWESGFPMSLFKGIPEAVAYLIFNAFVVWLLFDSRKKRARLEMQFYA
ncbi:MAG TPA: hypothetical protein PK198_21460 [Saprospiraceae bacterium]|nr:hypothetical protein [Saprospiraceae bacterium]HRF41381.1 hypothetical protein [Saprospiraceae bacterium]HRJ14011.1 hypothetical protein [Saprospiraceae bacterium]HRK80959.1 hypothetical protein [Saprospiraceae bacterium]